MLALLLYLALGPGLWTLFALGMAFSYTRLSKFRRLGREMPAQMPSVSALIPAKDEGEAVRACLDSALALEYPNLRIVAIDDRSTDVTPAIFDEYAAKHPGRFSALHIRELPEGWLGKCNALASAAACADSDWIFFFDSDVKVDPDSLATALKVAIERGFDAISLMPRLECQSFWDRLLVPLCAASVGAMTLMLYTNNDKYKWAAFANGQFILVRRSAYEAVGGHGAVRDRITEDVALFRLLKSKGYRVRVYLGREFASTRMHATLGQIFHGWARIFSGATERKVGPILLAMLFTLSGVAAYVAAIYGVIVMVSGGQPWWLVAAIAHLVLVSGVVALIYNFSANTQRSALLFPIAGPMMIAIYAFALRACRTGRIAWRGTQYISDRTSAT